jgi:acyl dehydratase
VLALALWLAEDAATEGKKVILAMLIVGLTFIAVIALGETAEAWSRRRRARRPRRY